MLKLLNKLCDNENIVDELYVTAGIQHRLCSILFSFFFSSRRRHTRFDCDWSSDVCSSDLIYARKPLLNHMNISWFRAADAAGAAPSAQARWPAMLSWRGAWEGAVMTPGRRSEERRVGKECRSRWSPYH